MPPNRPPPAAIPTPTPKPSNSGNGKTTHVPKTFEFATGIKRKAHRIGLFGPGGVGKTTLASLVRAAKLTPRFIDLEGGADDLDVGRVKPRIETWQDLRDALHSRSLWSDGDCVIIDTATAAQELAVAHTLGHVKHEKGNTVSSIEGYGWGKGYTYVADTFLQLLSDLDAHYRAGRNVIVICHGEAAKVPNPTGEDFLQYQPRLQDSNRSNIRARFHEWCDHLFYLDFDRFVSEDGKAVGCGSRTINTTALPTFWAKSRTLREPIPWSADDDATLWLRLFGKEA